MRHGHVAVRTVAGGVQDDDLQDQNDSDNSELLPTVARLELIDR